MFWSWSLNIIKIRVSILKVFRPRDLKQASSRLRTSRFDHLSKQTVTCNLGIWLIVDKQHKWMVELSVFTSIHYQNSVCVYHTRKSMSNDQYSCLVFCVIEKFISQGVLNQVVSRQIDISSSFVQNYDLCFLEQRSCQTHQLFLSNWKHSVWIWSHTIRDFRKHYDICVD